MNHAYNLVWLKEKDLFYHDDTHQILMLDLRVVDQIMEIGGELNSLETVFYQQMFNNMQQQELQTIEDELHAAPGEIRSVSLMTVMEKKCLRCGQHPFMPLTLQQQSGCHQWPGSTGIWPKSYTPYMYCHHMGYSSTFSS